MRPCAGLGAGAEGAGQRWGRAGGFTGHREETPRHQPTWEGTFTFFRLN